MSLLQEIWAVSISGGEYPSDLATIAAEIRDLSPIQVISWVKPKSPSFAVRW